MKPDYKKYKLRRVETKEQKRQAEEETVRILKDSIFSFKPQNLPEALLAVRALFALARGYYL